MTDNDWHRSALEAIAAGTEAMTRWCIDRKKHFGLYPYTGHGAYAMAVHVATEALRGEGPNVMQEVLALMEAGKER